MNNEVEIIDNFLPEETTKRIYKEMMSGYFPWHICTNVANEEDDSDDYYFTHQYIKDEKVNSDWYEIHIVPIIEKLNIKKIIRAKGNLYTNQKQLIEHNPHIDYDFEHKGALFCLNTCNGFTNFGFTKVDSVFNRMILFDPSKLHNSSTATDVIARVNINFNYW
tara:strand:- start:277 stop:768 length:492 start_codon:yes stop_codon:yes gene_type:complete